MSVTIIRVALASLLASWTFATLPAAADDTAAHSMADKFSSPGNATSKSGTSRASENEAAKAREAERTAARQTEARRKAEAEKQAAARQRAEEQEMLDRARREAAEREDVVRKAREESERTAKLRAEIARQQQAETARIDAERQAAAEAKRRAEQAERTEVIRRQREAEEQQRMAAEREAEQRRLAAVREAEDRRQAEEREANERRVAEERKAREIERDEEARRLAEKHNRLRAQREAESTRHGLGAEPQRERQVIRQFSSPRGDDQPFVDMDTHSRGTASTATVLLVMVPGNRGIRRFEKTAEPVLCIGASCYISTGSATDALKMPRFAALGPANTLGRRALACRHALGCVFRGVEIGVAGASLQPVDLRIMRHDRREAMDARPDASCDVDAGRLYCGAPIQAGSWRAWIVPEVVADRAGAELLKAALEAGLPDTRSAAWQ